MYSAACASADARHATAAGSWSVLPTFCEALCFEAYWSALTLRGGLPARSCTPQHAHVLAQTPDTPQPQAPGRCCAPVRRTSTSDQKFGSHRESICRSAIGSLCKPGNLCMGKIQTRFSNRSLGLSVPLCVSFLFISPALRFFVPLSFFCVSASTHATGTQIVE